MTEAAELVEIDVTTEFITQQRVEEEQQYVFGYTITISNHSDAPIRLLSRYWLITDANGDESTVSGEGVIGQQPLIAANESFTYSSGCILKTPVGTMQGHYDMVNNSNIPLVVDIPVFRLNDPRIMH